MKKIYFLLCVILCVGLTFSGCRKNSDTDVFSSSDNASQILSFESTVPNTSDTSSELPIESSLPEETVSSKIESQPIITPPPATEEETVSSEIESLPVIAPPVKEAVIGDFTVQDPENTRNLNTKKSGFSFGIPANGMPNNQSVQNQINFDNISSGNVLALDTKSTDKVMYLTFDCGYEYQNLTGKILDVLKEKNVKAAFFLTLSYIKNNPNFVRRMIDEGHIIGNHTATHPVFPEISRTEMANELYRVEEYLVTNFNYRCKYFRFPSGEYSECALDLVSSLGYKSIFWSSAYADWDASAQKGADYAYDTVTSRFHSGSVILLHAVSRDNAEALSRIIDKAHQDGYVFKTLDDYYAK